MTPGARRRGPGSRAGGNHPTRVELLTAAIDLAEAEGIDALTVSAITATAGHAKGTFYVHFDDRTELIVELHRQFHDDLFTSIDKETSSLAAGPGRARARIEGFLDGCRVLPAVRAMLLEARALSEIIELVEERNTQAASLLEGDLVSVTDHPRETAHLLVSATIEVARQELARRRRLPRLRSALFGLIPDN